MRVVQESEGPAPAAGGKVMRHRGLVVVVVVVVIDHCLAGRLLMALLSNLTYFLYSDERGGKKGEKYSGIIELHGLSPNEG